MIELTDLAAIVLVESVESSGISHEKGLRLHPKGDDMALKIDSPGENDRIIWHNGAIALIVDKELEKQIGNATIDIEDDPEEPYLVIRRGVK